MNISTFNEDLLDLQDFSQRLTKFIATEHDFVDGGLVIGLSSKYGYGKTTFLNMWRVSVLETKEHNLVIYLNAWESDYIGDPLFAIVSALAETVQNAGGSAGGLLEAAKDLGWFTTAIGSQVVNKLTGIDPVSASETAEKKKEERNEDNPLSMDAFSAYEGRKAAMNSLKGAITEIVSSSSPKALFLVDELDRCRPDYAIAYLETIKHLFDIKGAIFVIAADRRQLENSARKAFGIDLDFEEYYRKFVHREVFLPSISEKGYSNIAGEYVSFYLEREDSRFCIMELDKSRIDDITALISFLKLSPRQIQEVFRTLGHLLETSEEKRGKLYWCLGVGSIAMAALKIGAPDIYHSLGNRKLTPLTAKEFIESSSDELNFEWWFTLFYTGGGLATSEDSSANRVAADVFREVHLIDPEDDTDMSRELSQWRQGWGSSGLAKVYEKIQELAKWS